MKKIGLAIALNNEATFHTETFISAIAYSIRRFPDLFHCSLKLVNDQKSPEGGIQAANKLLEWGADVVVGHFSSKAAIAALPYYTQANTPVILPAATSCLFNTLPTAMLPSAYRYQQTNDAMMRYCLSDCIANQETGAVNIIAQGNAYGDTLLNSIVIPDKIQVLRTLPNQIKQSDTYVVLGYSSFARQTVAGLTKRPIYRIVLMDDSDCHDTYNACWIKPHRLSRIKSMVDLPRHGKTTSYWNETLLSLALGCSLLPEAQGEHEDITGFETYLGYQRFNSRHCYDSSRLVSEDIKGYQASSCNNFLEKVHRDFEKP